MEEIINRLKTSDLKSLERLLDIPYDRMYKWIKGKSRPKLDDYNKLKDYFENGKTSITSENIQYPKGDIHSTGLNKRKANALIPFYNADFMAGNGDMFYEDGTIHPEYYMDVPEFYGCTAFRAYSDSMESKIRSGAILFGIKIEDWYEHLEYGQIYGITCNDGRRYLKYIRQFKLDEDNYFLLKSENTNYDDFKIPKSKIKNVWLIEGWLDKRT